MNFKSILLFVLFLSSYSFSKAQFDLAQFFISNNDFAVLFNDTIPDHLICTNKKGEKLFVGFHDNGRLILRMKDSSQKKILLSTIKVNDGEIAATEITKFWEYKRPCTIPLNEIEVISIRALFITWATRYYNLDSVQQLYRFKRDSLEYSYTEKDRLMIELVPKIRSNNDTIRLLENACYHLELKNGEKIQYGVISKITSDSIFVTTVFAPGRSMGEENNESNFIFSSQDIKKINALKLGRGAKTLLVDDYDSSLKETPKNISYAPCWFTLSRSSGEIYFYRLWFTENGFIGIRYENGKYYWYEG